MPPPPVLSLRHCLLIRRRRLLLSAAATLLFIAFTLLFAPRSPLPSIPYPPPLPPSPTSTHHLLFAISSSSRSLLRRSPFIRLWFHPNLTRAFLFLDTSLPRFHDSSLPQIIVSADTFRFPYTFKPGLRSAIRIARIIKELVDTCKFNQSDSDGIRWIVLGDDDTVFFPETLARVLMKYDWREFYYIGANSEGYEQNAMNWFEMAFGGGGIAISYPLAKVLAEVMDSCLMRYGHLYGSDARIFACISELGVGLTHEAGFHQVDLRGDIFGMLSVHPLTPLVSLHHIETVAPLFPGKNQTEALNHLLKAARADPFKVLQQSVCYDRLRNHTMSISWGYSVQLFEGNIRLPDLLALPRTFMPWRRTRSSFSSAYMFNTREVPKDPCEGPYVYFMESVVSEKIWTKSTYRSHVLRKCPKRTTRKDHVDIVQVVSMKFDPDSAQLQAPRRHCCDVLSSSNGKTEIEIRKCKKNELIAMDP